MISAHCAQGDVGEALAMLDEMRFAGLTLGPRPYMSLINSVFALGDVERARGFFDAVRERGLVDDHMQRAFCAQLAQHGDLLDAEREADDAAARGVDMVSVVARQAINASFSIQSISKFQGTWKIF